MTELLPGFTSDWIDTGEARIFTRTAGSGPPMLLLHGYPQTHLCWHRVAPVLARHSSVVLMDLRGYGASSCPASDSEHTVYAKRAMARDALAVMNRLGHARFTVMGHDRGGRVAYRLALDHPRHVERLIAVDIVTTLDQWAMLAGESANPTYHWYFLAQPRPLPETLIASNAHFYADWTLSSWAGTRDLSPFHPTALAEYRKLYDDPARVHAMCEDYRAGATVDVALDRADFDGGRRIDCPVLAVWGGDYLGSRVTASPLDLWRRRARHVEGVAVPSGHFIAEEAPEALLGAVAPFLRSGVS